MALKILILFLIILATAGVSDHAKPGDAEAGKFHSGNPSAFQKIINPSPDKFIYSQFKNPDPFYWPAYFWQWNDTVTKDIISEQLSDMASHGALSVCLHPMPKAFRPTTMFTLMAPDYMTKSYLDLYRYSAEQCQKLKMKMYLYDEGGWPSGSCLGYVVEKNPSLIIQKLTMQIQKPEKGTILIIPPDCLSAFLYNGNIKIKRLFPGTTDSVKIDNARLLLFNVSKGDKRWQIPYPDLLNPESTREFLRLTHEQYKNVAGDYFGSVINITFTDEAQAANPPWTDDLAEDFKKKFGYDILEELPSIFEGDGEKDRKIRINYFDWWSQRNADAYYGQIQEWCHNNNLLSGGHLNGEDVTAGARDFGYGHALRALRRMDVPGVDVIWRQLWPGGKNHHFPKFASTVAHQSGRPWALTESFAVYGEGLTTEQMKWISDYQYVRGINLLVMSDYPESTRDWFLGGIRPAFGPGNPLWRYMESYHAYIARLGYLLSLGTPEIKIAVYYPVRDIWAGGAELNSICASNDELAKVLLENQCDFDFIDDDLIENDSVRIIDRQLVVGPMNYDVICISGNRYMSDKSISKLEQFIKAGGKVFCVDNILKGNYPRGTIMTTYSQLPSNLIPTVNLESPDKNIRVCKRKISNSSIYFVTNEDTCELSFKLIFRETLQIKQLDPETGKCWVPSQAIRTSEGWTLPLNLKFAGSSLFIFTNESIPTDPAPTSASKVLQTISDGWSCQKTTEFIIGDHDLEVKKHQIVKQEKIIPGDWRYVMGNIYSGDVEYTVNFTCTKSVKESAQLLDLGKVNYVCQASINGETLGKKLWQPFEFNIKGKLRTGYNILKVTVTNTLANQYIYTNALDKYPAIQLGPYHSRTIKFEKESVPSGLFGPVTIR